MTNSNRCSCPSAPAICDGPQPDCSVHGSVDGILALGRYTDRRGREWWHTHRDGRWFHYPDGHPIKIKMMAASRMRLLIERDQHRDACHRRGASNCIEHPVPIVYWDDREDAWMARPAGGWPAGKDVPLYFDLPEAMDAARALAADDD